MPRPTKPRLVEFIPEVTYFKPPGIPLSSLDEVRIGFDELEALRLKDMEGLEQEECAARMNLAQSTLQRMLRTGREKLTRALVEGKAIRIEGGNYQQVARTMMCEECGHRWDSEDLEVEEEASCPACQHTGVVPRWPRRGRRRGKHGRS